MSNSPKKLSRNAARVWAILSQYGMIYTTMATKIFDFDLTTYIAAIDEIEQSGRKIIRVRGPGSYVAL